MREGRKQRKESRIGYWKGYKKEKTEEKYKKVYVRIHPSSKSYRGYQRVSLVSSVPILSATSLSRAAARFRPRLRWSTCYEIIARWKKKLLHKGKTESGKSYPALEFLISKCKRVCRSEKKHILHTPERCSLLHLINKHPPNPHL